MRQALATARQSLENPRARTIDRRRLDDGRNALNLSKLRATDLTAFVQRHARSHSPSQARRLKMCKAFDIIRLVGARQRHLLWRHEKIRKTRGLLSGMPVKRIFHFRMDIKCQYKLLSQGKRQIFARIWSRI